MSYDTPPLSPCNDPTNTGIENQPDVYSIIADFMISSLENARQCLNEFVKGLEGAEKVRTEKLIKQVDEYLEKLKASKKASGLQKFFKALGVFGFVLALITAVLIPSPMTIALLVVTTAMFLEPMISQAAGSESLLERGMAEMFKAMSDALGPVGAAVMSGLIMVALAAAATVAVGGAMSAMASGTNAMVQSIRTFVQELPSMILRFFGTRLTPEQFAALQQFLEVCQQAILMAQAGLQIDIARLNFEAAKLMKAYGIDQALIDGWTKTIRLLTSDLSDKQQFLAHLEKMLPELFEKPGLY